MPSNTPSKLTKTMQDIVHMLANGGWIGGPPSGAADAWIIDHPLLFNGAD